MTVINWDEYIEFLDGTQCYVYDTKTFEDQKIYCVMRRDGEELKQCFPKLKGYNYIWVTGDGIPLPTYGETESPVIRNLQKNESTGQVVTTEFSDGITAENMRKKCKEYHLRYILRQIKKSADEAREYLNVVSLTEAQMESIRGDLESRGFAVHKYSEYDRYRYCVSW